jgi:ADP-heptose:LPS heptosyltransferase
LSVNSVPTPTGQPAASERALSPIVIRFGRLGDMIMLTAVLHLLHRRFGQPCQVFGAGVWNSAIYHHHPDVARVESFPRHTPFMLSVTWWRVLRILRSSHPSPIYVCERHPRQLVRVRRMLALSGVSPARCLFITDLPFDADEPWVERFVQFGALTPPALRASDYPLPGLGARAAPSLNVADEELRRIDTWLAARGGSGRPVILVQPGNFRSMSKGRRRWRRQRPDDKAWPLENWVDLLRRVRERMPQALVLLCGAPPEAAMLQQIQAGAAGQHVLIAALPLRPLFALCKRAHSMISVDTGPAHAAAALDLPLVVLFGAEPQRLWLPRGPSSSLVLGVGGPPDSMRVDQITVDAVFNAWCALLARLAGRSSGSTCGAL